MIDKSLANNITVEIKFIKKPTLIIDNKVSGFKLGWQGYVWYRDKHHWVELIYSDFNESFNTVAYNVDSYLRTRLDWDVKTIDQKERNYEDSY